MKIRLIGAIVILIVLTSLFVACSNKDVSSYEDLSKKQQDNIDSAHEYYDAAKDIQENGYK